jgi:hypothetical protein
MGRAPLSPSLCRLCASFPLRARVPMTASRNCFLGVLLHSPKSPRQFIPRPNRRAPPPARSPGQIVVPHSRLAKSALPMLIHFCTTSMPTEVIKSLSPRPQSAVPARGGFPISLSGLYAPVRRRLWRPRKPGFRWLTIAGCNPGCVCVGWLHVDYKSVPFETIWHVSCGLFNYDIISVCHVDCSGVKTRIRPMENDAVGKKISVISMTWPCLNLAS